MGHISATSVQRFLISGPELTITGTENIIQGTSVQRFLISGPELTITATASIIPGTSVHRFLISSPDLRIDVAKRSKQGQSVHRFSISSPDLRIDATKRPKQGVSVSAITCPRYKKSRVCALLFFSPFVWEEVPVCFGFGSGRHGGRSVEYIRQVVEEVDAHLTA